MIGSIELKGILVLVVDAHEESINIEFSTEGREDTLHHIGFLKLAIIGSVHSKLLLTDDGIGSNLTDLVSEVSPISFLGVSDGGSNLVEYLYTIDKDIKSNCEIKCEWASKKEGNSCKLLPVDYDW